MMENITTTNDKPHAYIRRWGLVPLGKSWHLTGQVLEHPNQHTFHARNQITSPVLFIDFEEKKAETLNTNYTLLDD